MSKHAEELLRVIVRRAVEAESIPLPKIWKERVVEVCVRVVHKLISVDAAVVAICAEFVSTNLHSPTSAAPDGQPSGTAGSSNKVLGTPANGEAGT